MCVIPRSQFIHVPYCSLRASIPQLWNICTAQSFAALWAGDPLSRGPMESSSA
jgi:hypothetical protein